MEKKALGYKIRNPKNGLYAISISKSKWGKTGRTWSRMCDVVRVINNGIKRFKLHSSSDSVELANEIMNWEIVELSEKSSYSTIHLVDKIKF